MKLSHRLFDTPLGPVALAWTERGLVSVQLPEATAAETTARLLARVGPAEEAAAPPKWVRELATRIAKHLGGLPQDFTGVSLDLDGCPPFFRRIYEALRAVGPGSTVGYGELAVTVGSPGASRAVGQAMARNPLPLIVPCHRVLGHGGRLGGFSAAGGTDTKRRLLALEGVEVLSRSTGLFHGEDELPYDWSEAVRFLSRQKPMRKLIATVGDRRLGLREMSGVFSSLAESILFQQLHGKAAAAIRARLCASFGSRRFPSAAKVLAASDEVLRAAGLSGGKIAALRDLADHAVRGALPSVPRLQTMSDEAIIEALTPIRGIGRWTVEMMLIFRLGRPDVWPVDDYGVRRGQAITWGADELLTPRELEAFGDRFAPYRSVAAWYFWRAAEMTTGLGAATGPSSKRRRAAG